MMRVALKKFLECAGPITLSALSLFFSFIILQHLAYWLDPSFNLLASRGVTKIAFIFLVIYQIFLFLAIQSKDFFNKFLQTNFYFFGTSDWYKKFLKYFILFFSLHALMLFSFFIAGFASFNPLWGSFSVKLILKTIVSLVAVFLLAWTEELIFRGTIYPYFKQYFKPVISLFVTSTIFMLVHSITNPLDLVTTSWRLGLGLFLLGMMLNLIFIDTEKLFCSMGAHAGLVAVKAFLRRMPILTFLPPEQLPFWLNKDLRFSFLTHIGFLAVIIFLFIKNRKQLH